MLRRSGRSAGIAPSSNDEPDQGVEPKTGVEARGLVGRGDNERVGTEGVAAEEGETKEPSEWDEDEDEEPADGDVNAGDGGGTVAEDGIGCDECAIREATMQGIRSRLSAVRLEAVQARNALAKYRSKQTSGGRADATRALEIVCSNTPRKNNDPRSNRVEKFQVSFETPVFTQIADSGERADSYGEQVRTSKAGDRATGESRDTCRTRVHPNSATSEGKAGAIAACSHVLPPDAQCHWSISQAQNRQRCEKRLKSLRRCFFLSGWYILFL